MDSAGVRIVTYDLTDVDPQVYRSVQAHDLEIGVVTDELDVPYVRRYPLAETER